MKPWLFWMLCGVLALPGCTAPALRSQSPEEFDEAIESKVRLVGEVARPFGTDYIKVESVGLVTGLAGTGEDPPPSPQRSAMLSQMQILGVRDAEKVLASPNTALVVVRGFLPPGVRKGDKIDLEVQVPSRSETTSLRGGWLMENRLTELAVLGNQIHEGHAWALGQGPIMVDPSADGEAERSRLVRGRVLGGGVALKSREMELLIAPEDKSFRLSAQIGEAVNRRFHQFNHGVKEGVAKPQTDERIHLAIHPRYKDNISRYVRVVRAIPIKETSTQRIARLKLLERQLLDPITAATAALRLEAIGREGVKVLQGGLESTDPEVRFYAAEALAYLDETKAAGPLAAAAREEPAFRAYALTALSAMNDVAAHDELQGLLDVASAETRYGAFRSLWAMDASDPLVRGENLGGQFSYHLVASAGPPMIHVTRSFRPEVVVFGTDQRLRTPLVLDAGKSIIVNAQSDEQVTVSKFAVGQPDQQRVVSNKVDDIIRAIVDVGGTYPDVVQALQQAKGSHVLTSRLEMDAIPDASRQYKRVAKGEPDDTEPSAGFEISNPLPELFSARRTKAPR